MEPNPIHTVMAFTILNRYIVLIELNGVLADRPAIQSVKNNEISARSAAPSNCRIASRMDNDRQCTRSIIGICNGMSRSPVTGIV